MMQVEEHWGGGGSSKRLKKMIYEPKSFNHVQCTYSQLNSIQKYHFVLSFNKYLKKTVFPALLFFNLTASNLKIDDIFSQMLLFPHFKHSRD